MWRESGARLVIRQFVGFPTTPPCSRIVSRHCSHCRGSSWKELGTLREAYDKLRQAQEFVMLGEHEWTASRSNYLDPHASDTHIANLDAIFPSWRDKVDPVDHDLRRGA